MILFTAKAVADSKRLYEFLEPKNPRASVDAMEAIRVKLELVERMPGLGLKTKCRSFGKSWSGSVSADM